MKNIMLIAIVLLCTVQLGSSQFLQQEFEEDLGGIWETVGGAIGNDIWNRGVANGECTVRSSSGRWTNRCREELQDLEFESEQDLAEAEEELGYWKFVNHMRRSQQQGKGYLESIYSRPKEEELAGTAYSVCHGVGCQYDGNYQTIVSGRYVTPWREEDLGGIWETVGGAIGEDIWNRGVANGECTVRDSKGYWTNRCREELQDLEFESEQDLAEAEEELGYWKFVNHMRRSQQQGKGYLESIYSRPNEEELADAEEELGYWKFVNHMRRSQQQGKGYLESIYSRPKEQDLADDVEELGYWKFVNHMRKSQQQGKGYLESIYSRPKVEDLAEAEEELDYWKFVNHMRKSQQQGKGYLESIYNRPQEEDLAGIVETIGNDIWSRSVANGECRVRDSKGYWINRC